MIKTLTAYTKEIDDPEAAVAELLKQLDLPKNQLKHSVGLISCYPEFTEKETGFLPALHKALPFDIVGSTTCLCATEGQVDMIQLSLTVLTSDDVEFRAARTGSVLQGADKPVAEAYAAATKDRKDKPAMAFVYVPLLISVAGDVVMAALDKESGGIPLFGSVSLDNKTDYSTARTIFNEEADREKLSFVLVYGKIDVSFDVVSLNEDKVIKQKAIITASQGNLLIGVNNVSALEYLLSIGLTRDELSMGLGVVPITVDYRDGTQPVARAVFTTTPEGYAVCGGEMPVNMSLGVGRIDAADVLKTAEASAQKMVASDGSGVLSFSCMARYLVLGARSMMEAETIGRVMSEKKMPYQVMYSGGEICPLPDKNGVMKNRLHNFTCVMCRIK